MANTTGIGYKLVEEQALAEWPAHANLHPLEQTGKPIVLFDSDGILTDLGAKWYPDIIASCRGEVTREQLIGAWELHRVCPGDIGVAVYDHLLQPGYFRDLQPIPGAQEGMSYLSQYIEPVIVTTVPPEAHADRVANLRELYPCIPRDNIIFTPRKDLVAPHAFLVEDAPKNMQHKRAGFICMSYPYNWHVEGHNIIRVCSWGELAERVMECTFMGRVA